MPSPIAASSFVLGSYHHLLLGQPTANSDSVLGRFLNQNGILMPVANPMPWRVPSLLDTPERLLSQAGGILARGKSAENVGMIPMAQEASHESSNTSFQMVGRSKKPHLEESHIVSEDLIMKIWESPSEEEVLRSIEHLKSPNERERIGVVGEIGVLCDARFVEALIVALREDSSHNVRLSIVQSLLSEGTPLYMKDKIMMAFIRALREDKDMIMRGMIAGALRRFADTEGLVPVVFALISTLDDANIVVRESVLDTLARIKDPRAMTLLIAALYHQDEEFQLMIVRALGQIGNRRALKPLKEFAEKTTERNRSAALEALSQIRSRLKGTKI